MARNEFVGRGEQLGLAGFSRSGGEVVGAPLCALPAAAPAPPNSGGGGPPLRCPTPRGALAALNSESARGCTKQLFQNSHFGITTVETLRNEVGEVALP